MKGGPEGNRRIEQEVATGVSVCLVGVGAPLFIPQAFTEHHSGPGSAPCNQQVVFARTNDSPSRADSGGPTLAWRWSSTGVGTFRPFPSLFPLRLGLQRAREGR